jgi:multidrug efflux pump subunit AcrB
MISSIIAAAVDRSRTVLLVFAFILLSGYFAFKRYPKNQTPMSPFRLSMFQYLIMVYRPMML